MVFVACGLNHKTAPIGVREQFSSLSSQENRLINHLVTLPEINEVAILSTCNRTELYCDAEDPQTILTCLANLQQIDSKKTAPYFYLHCDKDGIKHTLRVATGLDSMMIGEPQILGQMKQAYLAAKQMGTIGPNLRHVFQYVFQASKRIRTRSGICRNPISIAYAATQLIQQYFLQLIDISLQKQRQPQKQLHELNVFLIGSGETANLVARYLHQQGVKKFMVANRTLDHATKLAAKYGGKTIPVVDIGQYLSEADVVISATTCPVPFISEHMVKQALIARHDAPMFFLDLAVPRDIEAQISQLPNVTLYNIDDLQQLAARGMDERRLAAQDAERLIDIEIENYIRWHRSLRAKPLICDYRNQMQDVAQLELERAMQKLAAGQSQYDVLKDFGQRLVNKLTHKPTIALRQAALDNREELLELANYLLTATKIPHEEIT